MGWFGKVLGGAVGFALGGPVGAAIGLGLGAALDESDGETTPNASGTLNKPLFKSDILWEGKFFDEPFGIFFDIQLKQPLPSRCIALIRAMQTDGTYLKSRTELWRDEDGDFFRVAPVLAEGNFQFYLPYGALSYLPHAQHCFQVQIIQIDEQDNFVQQMGSFFPIVNLSTEESFFSYVIFLYPWIQLGMGMLRCKGRLLPIEVKALREELTSTFQIPEHEMSALKNAMKQNLPTDWEPVLLWLHRRFPAAGELDVLQFLAKLAHAKGEGEVEEEQSRFFIQIMSLYGIPEHIHTEIMSELGMLYTDYYAILGVDKNASWDEVKRTYRQKVSAYHPDKMAMLPPEFQELANQKLKEFNQAYEILEKKIRVTSL